MDPWLIWLIAAVVFAVGEIATLGFFLAPFAGGALIAALLTRLGSRTPVGGAAVGRSGMVIERIANNEDVGCVKIDGEVWTARSYDDDDVIEAGKRVQV